MCVMEQTVNCHDCHIIECGGPAETPHATTGVKIDRDKNYGPVKFMRLKHEQITILDLD